MLEQLLLSDAADAFYLIKLRISQPFAAKLLMIGDRESVGFLLDGSNEGKKVSADGASASGEKGDMV